MLFLAIFFQILNISAHADGGGATVGSGGDGCTIEAVEDIKKDYPGFGFNAHLRDQLFKDLLAQCPNLETIIEDEKNI